VVEPAGSRRVVFTRQAQEDAREIARSGLREKAEELLEILRRNPRQGALPFEELVGDLEGALSLRINIQHRLVYQVLDANRTVKVIRMWTHSEMIEGRPHRREAPGGSFAAPRMTEEERTGVSATEEKRRGVRMTKEKPRGVKATKKEQRGVSATEDERTGEREGGDREGGWRVW
jgi:toxin YoeB